MRCVVTGHDHHGKSVVLSDGEPPRVTELSNLPGWRMEELWATIPSSHVPLSREDDDPTHTLTSSIPPVGGTRLVLLVLPPEADIAEGSTRGEIDLAQAFAEFAAAYPEVAAAREAEEFGLHTTDSFDYNIVLAGELTCLLDDGVEVSLKAGECLIQGGAWHGWRNKGAERAVMVGIMVGATRR